MYTLEKIDERILEKGQGRYHPPCLLQPVILRGTQECGGDDEIGEGKVKMIKIRKSWISRRCRSLNLTLRAPKKATLKDPED